MFHPNLLDMRECAGKCLSREDALQLVPQRHMQADISRVESLVAQSWSNKPRENLQSSTNSNLLGSSFSRVARYGRVPQDLWIVSLSFYSCSGAHCEPLRRELVQTAFNDLGVGRTMATRAGWAMPRLAVEERVSGLSSVVD